MLYAFFTNPVKLTIRKLKATIIQGRRSTGQDEPASMI
jgi:hypothetical protein